MASQLSIPLQAVPNQSLTVNLDGQEVGIDLRTLNSGLYMSISLSGTVFLSSIIVMTNAQLINQTYYGFSGQLMMIDTQGTGDPDYTGLGTRWLLIYTPASS
jgi:hypothetical protein